MSEGPADLLIAGVLTCDGLRLPAARWSQPGGAPWHAGLALAGADGAAGARTAILARMGPWTHAFALPALRAAGLSVEVVQAARDTAFVNDYRAERRWQWLRASAGPWRDADLPAGLPRTAAAAVSPLLPDGLPRALPARAKRDGAFVGLDVQGLLRRPGADGRIETVTQDVSSWAADVHALKFSAREFAAVYPDRSEEAAARTLSRSWGVEVIVTHGGAGAVVAAPGGAVTRARRDRPAPGLADTTGGGDIFLAAYVRSRAAGSPVPGALEVATDAASATLARRAALLPRGDAAIVAALRGLHATALWAWRRAAADAPGRADLFAPDSRLARALGPHFPAPILTDATVAAGPGARGPALVGAAWALASRGWPAHDASLEAASLAAYAAAERARAWRVREALLA